MKNNESKKTPGFKKFFYNSGPSKWGEIKIKFSVEGCIFLSEEVSEEDLEKYKKAEWVELRIAKEELFKKILKMNFEEFKTHLTIETEK